MAYIAAAAITAASALGGGYLASQSAQSAADAQAASAAKALKLQKQMWLKQLELNAPFREAGLTAQNRLLDLLGLSSNTGAAGYGTAAQPFTMANFQADPGYAFRLSEGMKALNANAAARGGLISGNALKAAEGYGQDMASQEYTNAFNRYYAERNAQLNPLQSLLGSGQTATAQVGNAAQNYANAGSQALGAEGAARASGYMGAANAWTQALGNASNAFARGLSNNYMYGSGNYGYGTNYPGQVAMPGMYGRGLPSP